MRHPVYYISTILTVHTKLKNQKFNEESEEAEPSYQHSTNFCFNITEMTSEPQFHEMATHIMLKYRNGKDATRGGGRHILSIF